uniref:ZP domain-containing protein n=1 Tax=Gasterosteus aculeatus aculeatus TaxID=481459 RepID=A0AAQ4REH7_GASAC
MHLKQTGYCFGVLLVHTVTTITLPPVASVYSPPPNSHLSPLDNDRGGGFTPEGLPRLSPRGGRERPRRGGESGPLPYFHNLEVGDRQRTKTSGLTPEHTVTSADKGSGSRNEPERRDGRNMDCGKGMIERVTPGSFYITGPFQSTWHAGHQADPAAADQGGREGVGGQERVGGRELSGYEASWQKLQPVVHCGDNAMTLTVRRRRAVQLQLGRVKESSVPFSQLPAQCGYSVHSTWRDFSLTAPYGACHVTQEDGGYALPLLWRGTPVKMSCPAPQMQPEAAGPYALCCSLQGMTVKVKGLHSTEELRVNVRGKWNPLGELAEVCGYTVDRRDADIILAAPFMTCGVTVKDGKYTLSLQVGEKMFTLACPVSPPEELSLTHQPVVNSPHLTRGPAGHLPESPLAFPWVPPFYLAPPYHPHPTYPLKYPSPDGHAADNPAAPSSSTPDPTLGPQPPPAADPWTDDQNYFPQPIPARESDQHFAVHSSLLSTDDDDDNENSGRVNPDPPETPVLGVSERYSATRSLRSDTGLLIQGDSPTPLQPPSHAFNPYYHYYHHPKIPLPAAPKDSDPGPEFSGELTSTNPNNPENRAFPLNMQRPEALRTINARQFLQAAPHSYTLPTKASAPEAPPHPPQPYPYRSYYPPHIAKVEARRMAPLNPDAAAKNNLSDHQNSKSNAFIHPLPCSSSGYNLNMNTDAELDDGRRLPAPADQPALTYPPRPDAVAAPPTDQPSFPTPPPYHNLPFPYYYHPYLHYHMYYGPGGSPSADNRPSQTSSSDALENLPPAPFAPPHRPSYPNHQSTTPPTKSTNDIRYHPLYPYYNFHYNTQQHPSDAFGRPAGEKAERLDSEMTDKLKATPSTPSPTGLGTEFDCSVFLGCCSYPVKSCTKGPHLILALPDSVREPTVPPPAHPSQRSNGSCTLYKLTSDRDLYAVPLEGCGVIQHVFGETVVHLLEVHGIHSLQRGHSSELVNSPVRLMVACSASPGSPGEVTLHVMAQPPPARSPPAAVTVLLRIAKDESFTGFHPEAHLPLSLLRGRPVYVEVSLLNPPRPGLVLLVHSCLAYTRAPYASWMLVYDGCLDRSYSDRLLPPHHEHHHIRRFIVSGFLSLNSQSLSYAVEGGHAHPQDPEIYFLCLTEVCSASHGDCTVGCINGRLK